MCYCNEVYHIFTSSKQTAKCGSRAHQEENLGILIVQSQPIESAIKPAMKEEHNSDGAKGTVKITTMRAARQITPTNSQETS